MYLIDTNVLLRFIFRSDPRYPVVKTAIRKLRADKHTLYISSQNCIEFWNVATRPTARNGFGLTPTDAKRNRFYLRGCDRTSDTKGVREACAKHSRLLMSYEWRSYH